MDEKYEDYISIIPSIDKYVTWAFVLLCDINLQPGKQINPFLKLFQGNKYFINMINQTLIDRF